MAGKGRKYEDLPDVSFTDFIFDDHEKRIEAYKDRPWIVDIPSNKTVTFGQVKRDATNIAIALAEIGFKKGDSLFFVTHGLANLILVEIGVWILGGVTRGCDQQETVEVYAQQIKEIGARFVVVDEDTMDLVQKTIKEFDLEVNLISIGDQDLPGTVHISKLLENRKDSQLKSVKINPAEDPMTIFNTSGSVGFPKGVLHSHRSSTAFVLTVKGLKTEETLLQFSINYGVGIFGIAFDFWRSGHTVYHINKFEKNLFFQHIMKHKPRSLLMYPFIANWFARCAWVLDPTTADLLFECLPNTHLEHIYGMSEAGFVAASFPPGKPQELMRFVKDSHVYISTGLPLPRMEIKVIDMSTSETLQRDLEEGEVCVRAPSIAKGYIAGPGYRVDSFALDNYGWFKTGDVGFLDAKGRLYIKDRVKFIYRVGLSFVSAIEIESVLLQHPDVQEAGVVAIPEPAVVNILRAFVVLKPSRTCSEADLCNFVADRMPDYKRLHGGVRFIEKLPANKGGKLDRKSLKEFALAENH
ncbi:Hypothetical predicted protein [Cloeon dipterum]|uniref:Uncharacterized protein n=1 Tax=Cloeon dipterum TaxID=197152 RepID=A0A8S1BT50_9INSE|nr:Hypothetical predicted protein [Cloeon dipterum]